MEDLRTIAGRLICMQGAIGQVEAGISSFMEISSMKPISAQEIQ